MTMKVPEGYDPHAWVTIRNKKCTDCKLHQTADKVCETGTGSMEFSAVWVVSKMPNSPRYQQQLEELIAEAGLNPKQIYYTSAVKCRTFEQNASNVDVKICRSYLEKEIYEGGPRWILALGNEALLATTGHSGITNYRAKIIERTHPHRDGGPITVKIVPTVSPSAVTRNPGMRQAFIADLRFFAAQVMDKAAKVKPPKILYVDTKEKFDKLKVILSQTRVLAFDIETTGETEFHPDAAIVSLSGTSELRDGRVICWALPLFHPQSPFRSSWQQVLLILKPYLEAIPIHTAHNGKFDCRWMRRFGVWMRVEFDTMLSCHLLDENALKRLKAQCTARFGVPDWSIDTGKLLQTPIRDVLKYNGHDAYYQYWLRLETKQELMEQPRLLRIFQLLMMPANEMLIEAERRGIWRDPEKLATAKKQAQDMRAEIERQLMEYVPPVDTLGWPTLGRRGKPAEVNFNASNFARWWLFTYLNLPVIRRGKEKPDGRPGDPSMAEDVMLELKPLHPAVKLMLDRVKWNKYCTSFLNQYEELADANGRIHTSFKLFGTVTGRLSSGKEDPDKVVAVKKIRGVNIQQVPRDPLIRGIFGAEPGYDFVEADFSQIELRVVAFLSGDRTMTRLYQLGEDIHLATASSVLGIPRSQVGKEDRKKAKAVNFGFVYGMGWRKFIRTAFEKYELIFSEAEAQQIRRLFFEQFRGLQPWHARQRRLVHEYGRVQSPIGRIRHLPDIFSGDEGVRAEAERQAINSPVQSFASDMTMLAMLEINRQFQEQQLKAYVIGTVHDALLFEIKKKHTARALPIIKDTMENLPLKRKFGVDLTIPIVADIKVGTHWGDARELTPEEVYSYAA